MYDVIVVGSGYGGSVVAARLASKAKVLLVERGRRWRPGDFPSGMPGLARAYMGTRNPTGLWAMRLGKGTGNAFASAFGGSSVVNYGITTAPDPQVFDEWPLRWSELEPYLARAHSVLRPEPNPIRASLGDAQFLDMVEPGRRFDIENTIDWETCDQCGRCVPGCNRGSKRSLDVSYLQLALDGGVAARLETEVQAIAPASDGSWLLTLSPTAGGEAEQVRTRKLVLACGTLGTLDLLRRSRRQLALGRAFGQGMSMNGDGLAFLYDTKHRLSSHHGAPISTAVRLPFVDPSGVPRSLMVMSGRVPLAAMRFAGASLAVLAEILRDRRTAVVARSWRRRLRDLASVGANGALSQSFMYKLDGKDASRGIARFSDQGAVIDWADYADDPVNVFAARTLRRWAQIAGGTVIPNVARLPGMRSFSVHPLGGCRMGTSVEDGVVDEYGRVFDPKGSVYAGLRIADGSVLPGSLGVPPSLTISAIAERIADNLAREIAREAA